MAPVCKYLTISIMLLGLHVVTTGCFVVQKVLSALLASFSFLIKREIMLIIKAESFSFRPSFFDIHFIEAQLI